VILVDWSIYAGVINYFRAARKSKLVGQLVGRFVDLTKLQKVHIIGHSLGAHAAGFAGETSKRNINRITGKILKMTFLCKHSFQIHNCQIYYLLQTLVGVSPVRKFWLFYYHY